MTTSAQRLTYYSWRHWRDQEEAIYKYMDNYDALATWFLKQTDRDKEVLQSARERAMYCHVNKFKMFNDSLPINGVAFGLMLDEELKRLHDKITRWRVDQTFYDALIDEVGAINRRRIDNVYDRERRYRNMSITERCFDIMREVAQLSLKRYAAHPIYASYDKGKPGGDETVITVVGERGREVLTNEQAMDELKTKLYAPPVGNYQQLMDKVLDDIIADNKKKNLLHRIVTWCRSLFPF